MCRNLEYTFENIQSELLGATLDIHIVPPKS